MHETAETAPTVIETSGGWRSLDLAELWRYRELLYFFVWRDVKVRYKQAALGATWAVLQPLLSMTVFAVFFGYLAKMPSDGLPYPLFALAGLVPWLYFANALTGAAGGLVSNAGLISRVYFPRVLVPLAAVLAGLVDLAIGVGLLLLALVAYGHAPGPGILLLPAFTLLAILTATAMGTILAALNVQYRDVRYAVPFVVQVWMFATPVVYPASLVPERLRALYGLNPMAGVVEGFRWAVLGRGEPPGPMLFVSTASVLVVLAVAAVYFRRVERRFADVV